MQIIIDIPNKIYDDLMKRREADVADVNTVFFAIANGTPLPKGHGRLIDVNDLLDRIGLEDNGSNRADNVGEIITLEDFDFTPTIIPADKAEQEETTH